MMSHSGEQNPSTESEENRYILFKLGNEQYCVSLLDVKEVLESPQITPVPNAISSFSGVSNVKGQIVGVLDLRTHFGITASVVTRPVVLIFETATGQLAAMVDEILKVIDLVPTDITRSPSIVAKVPSEYLSGIATVGGVITCLIDLKMILNQEELGKVSRAIQSKALKKAA
jgi:purine-binding chemotaxis protein CheW